MSVDSQDGVLFQGFSKLNRQERYQRLVSMGAMTQEECDYLLHGGVSDLNLAEKLIENVIGFFQLPLGVATHFCIDGKDRVIPMAVEETSIIAALSKNAKWIRNQGYITTSIEGEGILGQIQLASVRDIDAFRQKFMAHKSQWIEKANQDVASSMVKRGGGVLALSLRELPRDDGTTMAVIHLVMNSCDAMGANIINQVLEYLKDPIEAVTGETVTMCILSNLNDQKLTRAEVVIHEVPEHLGYRLQEASLFAETDPYRAATHNKGVMNGIDPLMIATGNDWRAVEAGMHAYACRGGQYRALTKWRYFAEEMTLRGELVAPIIVGTVGGVTALHPTARLCLKMLSVTSASELSRIAAAVGLVQNLGAIRALSTEGIIQGHMKLHIDNLAMAAGATEDEMPRLQSALRISLQQERRVSLSKANEILQKIRQGEMA